MRFLLDESADARLVPYLRSEGHEATRIATEYPAGLPDIQVLALAVEERRVLITADRDFGDLVVRLRLQHCGIVLFRLGDYAELAVWTERMAEVLSRYGDDLEHLVVVTRQQIRTRRLLG